MSTTTTVLPERDVHSLRGRNALVIGGSRGIGRATALALARAGAGVAVNYVTAQDRAREVVEAVEGLGATAVALRADLGDPAQVETLFAEADAALGGLDIVVVNAAATSFGPLDGVEPAEFDRVFAVNVRGFLVALQQAARRVRDGGRIITVSTVATTDAWPGSGVYAASKIAGEQLTLVLAKELGARGITVNSVAPGLTDTDGMVMPPEAVEAAKAQTPLGRIAQPDDIADVIVFLASDAGRWINAQRIRAAGGLR